MQKITVNIFSEAGRSLSQIEITGLEVYIHLVLRQYCRDVQRP